MKKHIVLLSLVPFFYYTNTYQVTDFGKLYPTQVNKIEYPATIQEIQAIIKDAYKKKLTVSIAGVRHSQGGQSNSFHSINIDTKKFNKLLHIDKEQMIVKVQSGMTWKQLQAILHPYDLSVGCMQASNIFTIGGSVSVNVHGRDPFLGPIIDTVKSITIINDRGNLVYADRHKNSELFYLAIGGYGLFGFIAEVELYVKKNCVCKRESHILSYKEYPKYLIKHVLSNKDVQLHYARLNTTPHKDFLKNLISVEYIDQKIKVPETVLLDEKNISFNQFFMQLYRKYWGRLTNSLRWVAEKYLTNPWEKVKVLTRNHAMSPYIHALANPGEGYTDLLQEYFIPLNSFNIFVESLASLSTKYHIKLLNVTLRWTPKNEESFLSYSKQDTVAFVLYFTCKMNDEDLLDAKKFTIDITKVCLDVGGTFYLPYQRFATKSQLLEAYSQLPEFMKKKKVYDSSSLFVSNWYKEYIQPLGYIKK